MNKASLAPEPAGGKCKIKYHKRLYGTVKVLTCHFFKVCKTANCCVIQDIFKFLSKNTFIHLVCCSFMLCDPLCVLAPLRGRELGHPDLTITGAHGQGGVPTVRQKLCLCEPRTKRKLTLTSLSKNTFDSFYSVYNCTNGYRYFIFITSHMFGLFHKIILAYDEFISFAKVV